MAANIGSGYAKTYGGIIVARIFVGVGASAALAISGATVRLPLFTKVSDQGLMKSRYAICFFKVNVGNSWVSTLWLSPTALILVPLREDMSP